MMMMMVVVVLRDLATADPIDWLQRIQFQRRLRTPTKLPTDRPSERPLSVCPLLQES